MSFLSLNKGFMNILSLKIAIKIMAMNENKTKTAKGGNFVKANPSWKRFHCSGNSVKCIGIDLMHNDVSRLDAREECWS
jgi:hypothetical protein